MKILAIADVESKVLWDFYEPGMLDDIDLILSAGDLDHNYLSFLVTMAPKAPLLYVHGNHDTHYDRKPPEGCICIDDSIYIYKGLRIMGLGGSHRYNNNAYQYTEKEMQRRVFKMTFPLLYHKGFDILLTHAPIKGFHDQAGITHCGFQTFDRLIRNYRPAYHIHGHVHKNYCHNFRQVDNYHGTRVINAYEKYIFDYESPDL